VPGLWIFIYAEMWLLITDCTRATRPFFGNTVFPYTKPRQENTQCLFSSNVCARPYKQRPVGPALYNANVGVAYACVRGGGFYRMAAHTGENPRKYIGPRTSNGRGWGLLGKTIWGSNFLAYRFLSSPPPPPPRHICAYNIYTHPPLGLAVRAVPPALPYVRVYT
jgi:hypothetical protein